MCISSQKASSKEGRDACAPGKIKIIAIAGGSGSGKSWLADLLVKQLGGAAVRLSLDNFYQDRSALPLSRREKLNFDHPRAVDWKTFEAALSSLSRGKPAFVPEYDFATHTRKGGGMIEPAPVIILDGLWSLRSPRVRRLVDLGIFMDCPARTRLRRRLERDTRTRGRTASSVRRQFRASVEPMHVRFVEPQRKWAALVVKPEETEIAAREILRRINADRSFDGV
jgi:uridine kinase